MSYRTSALNKLAEKYGWTVQDGVAFNTAGLPIVFFDTWLADDHRTYTNNNIFSIDSTVAYGGKSWWKIGDYIYDHYEMFRQAIHETYGFGRFTAEQLEDIECIFLLMGEHAYFSDRLTMPLYWDPASEVTVSRRVSEIFEQFVRFQTSKLPFDVTIVWDDDTIATRTDEFVTMSDVGPEYLVNPADTWVESEPFLLSQDEIDLLMEDPTAIVLFTGEYTD